MLQMLPVAQLDAPVVLLTLPSILLTISLHAWTRAMHALVFPLLEHGDITVRVVD